MKKLLFIFYIFSVTLSLSQENSDFFFIRDIENSMKNYKLDKDGYFKIKISEIEPFLENHVTHYENNGYPFAEVKLKNIKENKADLSVNRGTLYAIDSLAIYGNTKLTEKQLFKLIGIKKGGTYNQEKLDEINSKLTEITYLKKTKEYSLLFHKNTVDIYFYLSKVEDNFIDGIIGFSNDEQGIKLNGYLNSKLINTLNYGEEINVNWRSEQSQFQKLESYILVNNIYKEIGLDYNLNIYRKYSDFTNTNNEFTITKKYQKHTFGISYQSKQSIAEISDLQNTVTRNIGMKYQYKNINTILLGYSYFGNRKIENELHQYTEFGLKGNYIYPIFNRFKASLNNISKIIISENLQESELLFFGGASSLKGFKEDEFKVKRYNLSSITLNYDLDKSNSANIFFQQAYYQSKGINEWAHSVGLGFDLKSKSGIIYFKYAIGFNKKQSLNIENGRIHIGVKNTF